MPKRFLIALLLILCFVPQTWAALFCPKCGYRNELDPVESKEVNKKGITVTRITRVRPPNCKNLNCKADLSEVPNSKRPPLEIIGKTQFWGISSYSLDEGDGSSDFGVMWQDLGLAEFMLHPERRWKPYWEIAVDKFGSDAFGGAGEAIAFSVNWGRVLYFADNSQAGKQSRTTGLPRQAKVQTAYMSTSVGFHQYSIKQYISPTQAYGNSDTGFTYGFGIGVGYIYKTMKIEYRKTMWDADFYGADVDMGGGRITFSLRF